MQGRGIEMRTGGEWMRFERAVRGNSIRLNGGDHV